MTQTAVPALRAVLVVGKATTVLASRVQVAPFGTREAVPKVGPRRGTGGGVTAARLRAETVPRIVPAWPLAEAFGRVPTASPVLNARDGGAPTSPTSLDAVAGRPATPRALAPVVGGASAPASEAAATTTVPALSPIPTVAVAVRAPSARTATSVAAVVGALPRGVTAVARAAVAAPSGGVHGPTPLPLAAPRPVGASPSVTRVGVEGAPSVLEAAEATVAPLAVGGAPVLVALVPQTGPARAKGAVARPGPLSVAQALAIRAALAVVPIAADAAGPPAGVHCRGRKILGHRRATRRWKKNGTQGVATPDVSNNTMPPKMQSQVRGRLPFKRATGSSDQSSANSSTRVIPTTVKASVLALSETVVGNTVAADLSGEAEAVVVGEKDLDQRTKNYLAVAKGVVT